MKTYSKMKVSDFMADSANSLPVLTDEQRRRNLEKAAAVRKERKALLDLVREGAVSFEEASSDPKYWRIPVVRLLIAVPGVGKAKATQLMTEAGVSPTRRVKGLGCRQREYIIANLSNHGA